MHGNGGSRHDGGSTFFQELFSVKFASLILVAAVLVVLPTYWLYGDEILNGPKQKELDTLVDGLFEARKDLWIHDVYVDGKNNDFQEMLDARSCALEDIEPFGLEKYPVPVVGENPEEESAVSEEVSSDTQGGETADAEDTGEAPTDPGTVDSETVGDESGGDTTGIEETGDARRRLQDDPANPSDPEVTAQDDPAEGGTVVATEEESNTEESEENVDATGEENEEEGSALGATLDTETQEADDPSEPSEAAVVEDPSTFRKTLEQTKCTIDYMFSIMPKGQVKKIQDSAMELTGQFKPPKDKILKKWKALTPMTYDLADTILTQKLGKPLTYGGKQANTEWVEDVYMKIGDSMFFYTGQVVDEKAEGFGRFYNEFILAEGQVSGGQEQGILRVIRADEDYSYVIGLVEGRSWSWFYRYDEKDCLIGQKTDDKEGYLANGDTGTDCKIIGYDDFTWKPDEKTN